VTIRWGTRNTLLDLAARNRQAVLIRFAYSSNGASR
jgi:hypothetical protein